MVTEAGKELLRNTINTAKFHNRILEENEMWKQFELERGLTMMVSDDLILKRFNKKNHRCSKHRRRSRERTEKRDINAAGSSKEVDRWDHSGYQELYPEEAKWDHSGFLELYPEEADKRKNTVPKTKGHLKKEKKKKKKPVEVVTISSSSDTEIWEEFKTYKRKKASKKSESIILTYDSHVKDWKKRTKE